MPANRQAALRFAHQTDCSPASRDKTMQAMQATSSYMREALEILFEKSNFKLFQKVGCPSHYWAPLVSACSGTRRDEIFYLMPDDVIRRHDVEIIHIKVSASARLASGAASRDIPLHPTLKRLGFLEFVQNRRRTHPQERLFSEYKASQEHAGMLFSRSFVNWVKTTAGQLPAEKRRLFGDAFHFPAFRALFEAEAIRSGMSEGACRVIYGIRDGFQGPRDDDQKQGLLETAAAEMRRMDIESYFPALYTYDELMGS